MSFRRTQIVAIRAFQTPTAKSTPTSSPTSHSRGGDANPTSHQQGLSLPTLLIFVIILVIICIVVAYRFFQLRQQGRPLSQFFTPAAKLPKPQRDSMSEAGLFSFHASHIPNSSTPSVIYPVTTPPAAHVPCRIRATDLDPGGRRLGMADLEHGQFDLNELPVYEKAGSPPKYGGLDGPPQYIDSESVVLSPTPGVRVPANL